MTPERGDRIVIVFLAVALMVSSAALPIYADGVVHLGHRTHNVVVSHNSFMVTTGPHHSTWVTDGDAGPVGVMEYTHLSNGSLPALFMDGGGVFSHPTGIAFYHGDLWVGDDGAGKVFEFTPPFTSSEAPAMSISVTSPKGIAFDSQGNLWVAEGTTGTIGVIRNPATAPTPGGSITFSNGNMTDVAFDSQGNLWASDSGNNAVFEISSSFSIVRDLSVYSPSALAFGQNDNLWVTSSASSAIYELTSPSYNIAVTVDYVVTRPTGIALSKPGHLLVTSAGPALIYDLQIPSPCFKGPNSKNCPYAAVYI